MNTKNELAIFDEIVAGWGERVPCVWDTTTGRPCRRPARWQVIFHGCRRYTYCSHHFSQLCRINEALFRRQGSARCPVCSQSYRAWSDTHTAVRL